MQNQSKKFFRWMWGIGLLCIFLTITEILIGKLIFKNNPEAYDSYVIIMFLITLLIYATIIIGRYEKYLKAYEQKQLENAKKQLTTEFKQVLLNDSLPISKESFECQAKINNDGKIVCELKAEYKYESYEEFLKRFHFSED